MLAPIDRTMALIEPTKAPTVKPTTAPIEQNTAPCSANDSHANSHLANDIHAIQLPRVVILCSPTSPRVVILCSPTPPRVSPQSSPPSLVPCHHPACTFQPAQCCQTAQCCQINHCQSTGPTGFPLQVFPFYFYFCYCIIGLTSMLLPQGCADPLVSGDGQTVSYQPHIHANTTRSSREQHRCSHNP